MDCPECGGRLADYRLGDRAAVGCDDCGFVDIDAEHRGEAAERETWAAALDRFHGRRAGTADARVDGGETET